MKKIFLSLAVTMLIFSAKGQTNQKNNSKELASSTVNNTLKEDPHNPLVNGIPYDQYKIQVQAEEKQRAAKEAEAKNQQKEFLDKQAKINLPQKLSVVEKPKN